MSQSSGNTAATDSRKPFELVSSREVATLDAPEPPRPATCEFCGTTLYWIGVCVNGRVGNWLALEHCNCQEAVRKHRREREESQRKQDAEYLAKQKERQRQAQVARIEKIIGQSGMGERFRRRTFDSFQCQNEEQRKKVEKARAYARDFDRHLEAGTGIFFAGSVGTGKTHLAAAIANELMSRGIPVMFRTVIGLLNDIRRSYNGELRESDVLEDYKTVPLLVLDDLGKEKATEWAAATLYDIVNARYEGLKPIIVTTNFSSEDILWSLGDEPTRAQAILSRLQETSIYIAMNWLDYRTKR